MEASSIYKKVIPSITTISSSESGSLGTGFIYTNNGQNYICTAAHVVADIDSNYKSIYDNLYVSYGQKNKVTPLYILGIDKLADLAVGVVKDDISYITGLNWNTKEVLIGSNCFLIGNPLGEDSKSFSQGLVRDPSIAKGIYAVESIMTTAAAHQGLSGCCILNELGNVIGVLSSGIAGQETLSWGRNSNVAKPIIDKIIETKKDNNLKYLGGRLLEMNLPLAIKLNRPTVNGYVVGEAHENSGLETKDVILAINGKNLKEASLLTNEIVLTDKKYATVSLVRNNNLLNIEVPLYSYKDKINSNPPIINWGSPPRIKIIRIER